MTAEALCAQLVSTLGEIQRMLVLEPAVFEPSIAPAGPDPFRDRFESHFLDSLFDSAATEH
jgi:hypothetical protein